MATGRITKRAVDAIALPPAGKRAYLWDDTLKGFGCMVTDTGTRSYLVQYRIGGRDSATRRVTIGKHGSPWTPDTARDRAAELLEQVRRKVDPFDAERERLAVSRAEKEAKTREEQALAKLAFNVVATEYIEQDAKKNLRRWGEQEAIIERDLAPAFGGTPLPSISADDINDQLAKVARRSSSAALKAYVALRAVYAFAHVEHRKLFPKSASVLGQVVRPEAGGQRDRHLTSAEMKLMWEASKVVGWPFGPIYQLLLLTGMRLREVAEGRWSEIDLTEARWNIPGERSKNGKPHWVHLSSPALSIIKDLPRLGECELMFTTNGETAVSGFSRAKSRLDKAMLDILRNETTDAGTDPAKAKVNPFVIHDTRRTFARGCQRLGQPPEVVERLLGHITDIESGLKGVYQTYQFEPERMDATEKWANELLRIVNGGKPKVIQLRGAA